MKNLLLLLAFCCLAATAQAAILLVNNNNPNPGQYPDVDAAIAVANPGDTIYIAGSPFTYPNFTVSKNNLTFIGPGARSPRVLGQDADVSHIGCVSGTDGLKIVGIVFGNFNNFGNPVNYYPQENIDNVTIERCWIGGCSIWSNSNNWVIRNCIFNNDGINASNTPGRSNIIISHNLFRFRYSRIESFGGNNTGIFISNNVFCQTDACCWNNSLNGEFQNCLVVNNIFYGRPVWGGSFSNNIFSDNISFSINGSATDFPGGNNQSANNIINQDPLFTNFPANGNTYFEPSPHDLTLQAGSPAHNEGTDGTDMGLYGSGNIFSETGEPALPIIQNITIGNPAVQSGTNLNVTVEARNADPDQD